MYSRKFILTQAIRLIAVDVIGQDWSYTSSMVEVVEVERILHISDRGGSIQDIQRKKDA